MKKFIRIGLLILAVLIIFVILLKTFSKGDHSAVLDDYTCEAPCWRGISPGMNEQEALAHVNAMTDIRKDSLKSGFTLREYWDRYIWWGFVDLDEDYGEIFFHDNQEIFIGFSYIEKHLPLMRFVEKFGEPTKIVIEKGILDGVMLEAHLIYPDDGICLEVDTQYTIGNPNTYAITQLTFVSDIFFYDPNLELSNIGIQCLNDYDPSMIQPWKGYGYYPVTCLNNDSRLCNW